MAAKKIVNVPDIGDVTLTKRRGNTNIRLSYSRDGSIRVSLPYLVPYQAGVAFVRSKKAWLEAHKPKLQPALKHGDHIGKSHQLHFSYSSTAARPQARLRGTQIILSLPPDAAEESIQAAALRGAHRALKQEADRLLPQRVSHLAEKHGFSYASLTTKRLTSRWGSCGQQKNIVLNTYLMQLPWDQIDYVIVHELVHTEFLNHSPEFWARFEQVMPDAKKRRRALKSHPTIVQPTLGL